MWHTSCNWRPTGTCSAPRASSPLYVINEQRSGLKSMQWETVIGLEIHTQLATRSKIFSASSTEFGAEPNTQASLIDLGMPGVLPVLNREAVRMAVRFGKAIGAQVAERSVFARKNYFYPDLPKGYQISQYALHEDFHGMTGIDLNRAGTPLLEIVSEPDMRSAKEAVAYAKKIHQIVTYIGICDGNMQEGSFRMDANVSVRPQGQAGLGTRAELKNINSFRFLEKAINYEVRRQIEVLEDGGRVVQETRLYDADKDETRSMRSKEDANDYRYFPDPDLLPLQIDAAFIAEVVAEMPELPDARRARFETDYGLSAYDADVLTSSRAQADYFETATVAGGDAKLVANWVMGELAAALNKHGLDIGESPVAAAALGELVARIKDNTISSKIAKDVLAAVWAGEGGVDAVIDARGLKQITDSGAIEALVDEVLAANAEQVENYRNADAAKQPKMLGFFVGQIMKKSQGKANPQQVNALLRKKLGA